MEGESKGHTEGSLSTGTFGKVDGRNATANGAKEVSSAVGTNHLREAVERAARNGLLDAAQAEVLTDLVSRLALLGFEAGRIISVMVSNIASEKSGEKRRELALQLTEYLEGDGLAKDLVPPLSESFSLS